MPVENTESLEQYLARLLKARVELVQRIERPAIEFPLSPELPSGRATASLAYKSMERELRALEATKFFRLRERLVRLKNVLRRNTAVQKSFRTQSFETSARVDRFPDYAEWCSEADELLEMEFEYINCAISLFQSYPKFLVILLYQGDGLALKTTLESLRGQLYREFEVTVVTRTGESPVPADAQDWAGDLVSLRFVDAVEFREGATNSLNSAPVTQWGLALRSGDVLRPHGLYLLADAITRNPAAHLIYGDEDELNEGGTRTRPNFKPDWDPLLLASEDYLGVACAYDLYRIAAVSLIDRLLCSRWRFDLEATAFLTDSEIVHVPHVLATRRAMPNPVESKLAAGLEPAIPRLGLAWTAPESEPLVSIVIPTRDQVALLRACLESLHLHTSYQAYEVIVVDNGTKDAASLAYLKDLSMSGQARVVREDGPFNYSALNNLGVYHAKGEIVALLNNDLEIIEDDWLTKLVSYSSHPSVGVVGCLLLYEDRTIQHGGMVVGQSTHFAIHSYRGETRQSGGYLGRACSDQLVAAVTGACMVLRKALYEELGGLDAEAFPVTFNDVDICLKARLAGYKNVYAGSVACVHHESKSRGLDDTDEKRRLHMQSTAEFAYRWGCGYSDPYYNPNLALGHPSHQLSYQPRVPKPWFRH